jgi:ankyrin repeat protein
MLHKPRTAIIAAGLLLFLSVFSSEGYAEDPAPALMKAAKKGDLEHVRELLNKGADVNAKNKGGQTALMDAAREGNLEMVKLLIDKGADVNAKDEIGQTPLKCAVWKHKLDIVRLLLDKGADVNAKDKFGDTVLIKAIGDDRDLEIARLLLDKGADLNAKGQHGKTAMWIAARWGLHRTTELLEQRGAILTLEVASALGDTERVRGFLEKGTDGQDIGTALVWASKQGHLQIIKLLLAKGADVNAKDESGLTALVEASGNGGLEIVKFLLAKGADVNGEGNKGWTALKSAVDHCDVQIVKTLLDKGADINVEGAEGGMCSTTALDEALWRGSRCVEIVNLLKAHGAKEGEGKRYYP